MWKGLNIRTYIKTSVPIVAAITTRIITFKRTKAGVTGLVWGLWHTPLWLMEGLSPLDLVIYAISFMGAVVGISIIMGYIFGKHRNLIYCTIIHLLFNFLNALIIIDQNRMALVVALYAVLYLIAAVIMILINGTASKKHSRL